MALTKDNTYTNGDERLFYLSDNVDNSSIGQLCWSLIFQLQDDDKREAKEKDFKREPIKLYINSCGGSVYDMWALIDIILNSKTPIYTYCTGYAFSAAFKIFLAGHRRFATNHATFMYHQLSTWNSGRYQDIVEDMDETKYVQRTIEEYVIDRTDLSQSFLDEIREKKKDFYIHPEEALKFGIIDEII